MENEFMTERLERLEKEGREKIAGAQTVASLQGVKAELLGKQGAVTDILKEIPRMPESERAAAGRAANGLKSVFNALIDARREELNLKASEIPASFDFTVPGLPPPGGALHPITQMCCDLNDAFRSMGFEIFEESDITSELYAFDNLNFPPEHPARESMDTYWLSGHEGSGGERLCLRPHLTGASVRYLQTRKPPCRFVYPGRVYRNESTDARHERAFFQ
jgi:phenylalanyl-tRNA synthetase alpha chain